MTKKNQEDYRWCEHYGGPRDGHWCSTGDVGASANKGQLSYTDNAGIAHYYVLLRHQPGDYMFYAYAGTDHDKIWSNVIVGFPGCSANNYDPDLEPDWYNFDGL